MGVELARRLFGAGEEPLGRKLRFGRNGNWHTIVGLTGPVTNSGYAGPRAPEYYLVRKHVRGAVRPDAPEASRRATLLIRSGWGLAAAEAWLKREVARVDSSLPVTAELLERRVESLGARPRFNAIVLALFAASGLALAAVGLYGVIAFLVAQRTREMGVRLALGASPRGVTGLVVREAMSWTAAGLAAGLGLSWFAARYVETMLFQLHARDALTWASASALLALTAGVAAWLPARRAGRVDPIAALRADG